MPNRDDFEARAHELGFAFVESAWLRNFVSRITDELWNAYVAGQESVERINEGIAISFKDRHRLPSKIMVEPRGKRSLVFAGEGERQAALDLLNEWSNLTDTIHQLGKDLIENGESLQQYEGKSSIEGRLRQLVGMEFEQLADLLMLRGNIDPSNVALANASAILEEIQTRTGQKLEEIELPEESSEELVTVQDPFGTQAEAEIRLPALQEELREVERGPCTQERIQLRARIKENIAHCRMLLEHPPHEVKLRRSLLETQPVEPDVRVCLTAYEGFLVVCPLDPFKDPDQHGWHPKRPERYGSSIQNTKATLGISREALNLLYRIPRNHDAVGDVMWESKGEGYSFTWWGPMFRIFHPWEAEMSRGSRVWADQYVEIPNDVPEKAVAFIEERTDGSVMWDEPVEIT